jgi:hypothetical protein
MVRMESPRARPRAIFSRCANLRHPRAWVPTRSDPASRSQPTAAFFAIAAGSIAASLMNSPATMPRPEQLIDLRNHPITEPHTTRCFPMSCDITGWSQG